MGDLFDKKTVRGVPKSEENLTPNPDGFYMYGQNISRQYEYKILCDEKYLQKVDPEHPILAYASSVGEIGLIAESFYRSGNNGAFQGLFPKSPKYSLKVLQFVLTSAKMHFQNFGYDTSMADIINLKIMLPTKNNAIDFDFMEDFITEIEAEHVAEIEAEHVAEIEAYLTAAGFKDTELTAEEAAALNKDDVEWREYRLGDLFEIKSYKKRFDANKTTLVEGTGHPYIVRQGHSNGQKGYIDEDIKFLNEGNTISFGQDTATAFYQEKPYFTGDKIKILKLKSDKFSKLNALFFITAVNKAFSDFSWGASSYNIDTIKSQKLLLPTKNNSIDFDFMEHFIRAIEKEVIRGVVEFGDKKSAAYRKVVRN